MKRLLIAFGLSAFLFAPLTFAEFSDVSSNNPNSVAIDTLVEQEVLQGYEDDTFKPDQAVTRAEAIKIILLGMGVEVNNESMGSEVFSDVSTEDWFYYYIGTAADLGIIKGYEDGTFRPHQTVNRAEAVKITLETAGIEVSIPESGPFRDVSLDDWFVAYADYAKTWNIEPLQTNGFWHPEGAITRGNISELVYREQIVIETGQEFDEASNWLRYDFSSFNASFKVPFAWYHKTEGIGAIWLSDNANGQVSLLNPYVNGGTILITSYANPNNDSSSVIFDGLIDNVGNGSYETTINGFSTLVDVCDACDGYNVEWYIVLPNNKMLHLQSIQDHGDPGLAYYSITVSSYFEKIVNSIEYVVDGTPDVAVDEAVESIRSAIQLDGVGQEMMDLLMDLELIETDAIGVGTGPVDYFYSPSADITIKYERSFDVILDVRDGQTTSF